MESVASLLHRVRAGAVRIYRQPLNVGTATLIGAGAPLTMFTLPDTPGSVGIADAAPQPVRAGDTVLTRRPVRLVCDAPDAPVEALVVTISQMDRALLGALPPMLVVPPPGDDCPGDGLLDLVRDAADRDRPGQQVVADRLMDWLLVCILREWFDRSGTAAPDWHQAAADPIVGRTLTLMHEQPERPWTVASLAARVGVSRAALAKRFSALVGQPPLRYLTEWRMAIAADLLARPELTVSAVARRVGYADPFAFSVAFKRVYGVSPRTHRTVLPARAG